MSSTGWIAVASAAHVRMGYAGGFMQVCHGKAAPLRRLTAGDLVAYYSPTETFGGRDRLQAFTAIGVVEPRAPYQVDMGNGFAPFRRDVAWHRAYPTPIHPLLRDLSFSRNNGNWGYKLRFGLFKVDPDDIKRIAEAMGARLGMERLS
ncbi:EVE domain-containing protein [Bradyrhizobium sp. STM 3557]|uniref:EVE domain-containing protein n=1 Tax=Bradyrhizobium sp. STM 3557 TaxID=578920 RepID=UPI00388DAF1F